MSIVSAVGPPQSMTLGCMAWLALNAAPLLNIIGILCDIVGAFFVASEVVRQFQGIKYKGSASFSFDKDVVITPAASETEEYKLWGLQKYRNMKIGLVLLVFGFGLQVVANVVQIIRNAA